VQLADILSISYHSKSTLYNCFLQYRYLYFGAFRMLDKKWKCLTILSQLKPNALLGRHRYHEVMDQDRSFMGLCMAQGDSKGPVYWLLRSSVLKNQAFLPCIIMLSSDRSRNSGVSALFNHLLFSELVWKRFLFSELAWNISAHSQCILSICVHFISELQWNSQ
jgi:hypothetical protein